MRDSLGRNGHSQEVALDFLLIQTQRLDGTLLQFEIAQGDAGDRYYRKIVHVQPDPPYGPFDSLDLILVLGSGFALYLGIEVEDRLQLHRRIQEMFIFRTDILPHQQLAGEGLTSPLHLESQVHKIVVARELEGLGNLQIAPVNTHGHRGRRRDPGARRVRTIDLDLI